MINLTKYTNHLPECNREQDWSEAYAAFSDTPEFMRDQKYNEALEKVNRDADTCTCGLEQALKEAEEVADSIRIKEGVYKAAIKSLEKQLSNLHEGCNQRAQRLIDQHEIEKAKFEAELTSLREIAGKMGEALDEMIVEFQGAAEGADIDESESYKIWKKAQKTISAYTQYIKENESTQPKG